ncbi:MAG: DUF1565 domain-containing protein [Chloroflexi bacterium]|nr:DUF1565 domain-containing protein [Chloroflexota bacterium]
MNVRLWTIILISVFLISACGSQKITPPSLPVTPEIKSTSTIIPQTVIPSVTPTPTRISPTLTPSSTYFVSIDGSDANPGNQDTPWKTIQKAVNIVKPGDKIIVRKGVYLESIKITKSGSAAHPITLTSYQDELVTIDGSDKIALYSLGPVSYWNIESLKFTSTNKHTIRFGWFLEAATSFIAIRNNFINGAIFTIGNNQLFENNEIDGSGYSYADGYGGINDSNGGLGDNATHHNIYRENYIHDFSNSNARGIWSQGRTHDILIEYNRIENIWNSGLGQCINLDAGETGLVQWRQVVSKNTLANCGYTGIQLENVFDSQVEKNLINAKKGSKAGIVVINYSPITGCGVGGENNQYGDTDGNSDCTGEITNNIIQQNIIVTEAAWGWGYGGLVNWGAGGLKIINNTIYAANSAGNAAINFQSPAAESNQTIIQNNILYNGNGPAICALSYDSFIQDNHNLLYRNNSDTVYGLGINCQGSLSLADYNKTTGKGEHSILADPQFINPAEDDFHLNMTSPAIDAGADQDINTDIDGINRPQGRGFDIGAYELVGP